MSLQDKHNIDLITRSLDGKRNGIELYIIDTGDISDETQRLSLLVEKLTCYLNYIVSQQFSSQYPNTKPNDVLFRVLCTTSPTEDMQNIDTIYPEGKRKDSVQVIVEDISQFRKRYRL